MYYIYDTFSISVSFLKKIGCLLSGKIQNSRKGDRINLMKIVDFNGIG